MVSTRFDDNDAAIERLEVSAYTVPSDSPELVGTYVREKTTLVLVEASADQKDVEVYGFAWSDGILHRKITFSVKQKRDTYGCNETKKQYQK